MLHQFEAELAEVVALAFFIPLLIGTGGNAGAQTVMTVIRSLAWRTRRNAHVAIREATTGMLVGLLVADSLWTSAALRAPLTLALTVSVTMFAICVVDHGGRLFQSWPNAWASIRRCFQRRSLPRLSMRQG